MEIPIKKLQRPRNKNTLKKAFKNCIFIFKIDKSVAESAPFIN